MINDENITIRNCTFAYKCEMKWDELDETEEDEIKFCKGCQKEVYLCETDEDLTKAIKRNRCVAIFYPSRVEGPLGLILDDDDH